MGMSIDGAVRTGFFLLGATVSLSERKYSFTNKSTSNLTCFLVAFVAVPLLMHISECFDSLLVSYDPGDYRTHSATAVGAGAVVGMLIGHVTLNFMSVLQKSKKAL